MSGPVAIRFVNLKCMALVLFGAMALSISVASPASAQSSNNQATCASLNQTGADKKKCLQVQPENHPPGKEAPIPGSNGANNGANLASRHLPGRSEASPFSPGRGIQVDSNGQYSGYEPSNYFPGNGVGVIHIDGGRSTTHGGGGGAGPGHVGPKKAESRTTTNSRPVVIDHRTGANAQASATPSKPASAYVAPPVASPGSSVVTGNVRDHRHIN
jgi:hypothetical protein